MDQSRSNSVPLIHIDDLHDDEEDTHSIISNSTKRMTRSSFSLSSIQQQDNIWHSSTTIQHTVTDDDETLSSMSCSSSRSTSSVSSIISTSDEETSIAIPGRKTMISPQINHLLHPNVPMMDLSSDILYEDIWIDSPVFHEYLQSLEAWLYHYLTWLEKIEQCRQLEIAYTKSIALLYDQTKLMLNEPFYTSEECANINWPNDIKSANSSMRSIHTEEETNWGNKDIRIILPHLRDHGTKIKETLAHFESSITASRAKHVQLSSNYCAAQKKKTSQTSMKTLDEISTSLYVAKRALCKVLLEYIIALNNLIRGTRSVLNEKLSPLFEGLQSDKIRNLKTLEELVLTATDFIFDVKSKTTTSSSGSSSGISQTSSSNISSNGSHEDQSVRSASPFPRSSFEEHHELNNERLSYYIQEKLASYYSCLKNSVKQPTNEMIRSRPSSPTSLIPFTFLNKPKVVQRYNSLDSLLSANSHPFTPSFAAGSEAATKGYLFTKKKPTGVNSNCTNGINHRDPSNHHGGKWERYYFYISKEDGHLKQYKDQTTTFVVANLKTAIVSASKSDKRDFVIQITSTGTSNILSLQAETTIDFSNWFQALRSWNPQQITMEGVGSGPKKSTIPTAPTTRKSSIPYPRNSGTHGNGNRSFLTKKTSFGANNALDNPTAILNNSNNNGKKGSLDITISSQPLITSNINISPNTNLRASPTNFANTTETVNGELLFGYPVSVTECPINCCNTLRSIANQSNVQMTGTFKIHKLCKNKLSCTSHHTGTLCVLHVSLYENGVLHLQTEKDDNSFFHRPIQLSTLSPQDIYPFSDSIDHMKYCIVIRPQPSETYHLMTCSKIQRDAWLVMLKRHCQQQHHPKRRIFSLSVRIAEGRKFQVSHKDSIHSELYCDIVVDNEIRGLTGSLKKTSTLFWREEFSFSDISKMKHGVTITIYSKSNKNDRETIYGTVFLPVSQIQTGTVLNEEWYEVRKESRNRAFASLTGLGSSHTSLGQLRVGLLLEEHQVFTLKAYQPLMDVLTDFRHDIIYDMARKTSDVQGLARNLLRIYEGMGLTLTWIKSLIDYEVSSLSSDDVNILFRGNSFFTKVIDNYMKMSGKEFLEEALQFTIQKICKFSLHIEVESSRLSNSTTENTLANCAELFSHVRSIWGGIQRAKTKCPIELRRIFGHLQSAIVKKFDLGKESLDRHHQVARYTCVSGFIFLRWICPAIISPKQFGLVQDHPDTKTCRTLTLIAKCIMTLASHGTIEQNAKEPWMVRLNEFVQNNTTHFMNFINFVSVDDDMLENERRNEGILLLRDNQEEVIAPYFIDLALELSQLTSWCARECNVINMITRTCKSIIGSQRGSKEVMVINTEVILQQQQAANNRRKTRPQPWQYGDDYIRKENEVVNTQFTVRSPSSAVVE